MAERETCLEFKNISMQFPGVRALSDVSFSIPKGDIHALMGANGAGKSTLIKILARVYQQTEGDVLLNGESLSKATPQTIRDYGIDFIFQELELVPSFTVAQNIMIGQEPRKGGLVDWKRMKEEAQKALDDFMPGVIDAGAKIGDLSVAKQQIVCIVRALHRNPKIIVFDEPTSRLSATETEVLFEAIRKIRQEREITIIYVSHRLEELFQICENVTILRDGVYTGTWALKDMTKEDIVYRMVGEVKLSGGEHRPLDPQAQAREPIFTVENLSVPGLIHDVSFQVRPGEILALTGAVGAKKTEIIECLMGMRKDAAGKITLNGKPITVKSPRSAKQQGLCLIPEDRRKHGVIVDFTVRENTTLAFMKDYTNKVGLVKGKKERGRVQEMCQQLQVKTPGIETRVKNLSGGNIQKVVVGKWLVGDSMVYFFDEPTVGIDVRGKSEIYELIRRLAAEGKAVVVASSEIDEAIDISDRMVVLYNGAVVANRVSCEANREDIVYLTMGGTGHE